MSPRTAGQSDPEESNTESTFSGRHAGSTAESSKRVREAMG